LSMQLNPFHVKHWVLSLAGLLLLRLTRYE
jgi:hypothetical protein